MARNKNDAGYTIVIERKYSKDKVKAIDLFTRIISEKIIMNNPNKTSLKMALSEKNHSDIESC